MEGNNFPSRFSVKIFLKMLAKELAAAKEAQKKGKPFPPLPLIAYLLVNRKFDSVPENTWTKLGRVLSGNEKKMRGRPSTKDKDIALAEEYYRLRNSGKKDAEAIDILRISRNHEDERSTRKALARGREIKNLENLNKQLQKALEEFDIEWEK